MLGAAIDWLIFSSDTPSRRPVLPLARISDGQQRRAGSRAQKTILVHEHSRVICLGMHFHTCSAPTRPLPHPIPVLCTIHLPCMRNGRQFVPITLFRLSTPSSPTSLRHVGHRVHIPHRHGNRFVCAMTIRPPDCVVSCLLPRTLSLPRVHLCARHPCVCGVRFW